MRLDVSIKIEVHMHRTLLFTILISFTFQSFAQALTCNQIRDKADAVYQNRNKKSSCVLTEHTLGVSPGSTESVYLCGGKKYKLLQSANDVCKASAIK